MSNIDISNTTDKTDDKICFNLSFTFKEWLQIKPENVEYHCKKLKSRTYLTLQRKAWTNILFAAVYKETKLPCAFSFKRAKITESSIYLQITGSCNECGSEFYGCIVNEPAPQLDVRIECEVSHFDSSYQHCKKRQLKGNKRVEASTVMVEGNIMPSILRRKEADRIMDLDDPEPPYLPKLSVLRKAKEERCNINLGISGTDPVQSILQMKYEFHQGSVHSIGIDSFFVHYWTTEQTAVYIKYFDKIFVDATGSLVKKIKKPDGELSSHIYLYQIVTETPTSKMPVFQMLSSVQNTNAIQYWLFEILRLGSKHKQNFPLPREVICDFDKALLGAIARAFGQCKNLKDYLAQCFLCITGDVNALPSTFIRLDICHYMHFVSRWKILQSVNPRVKKFYIIVMGLLTKQRCFEEFKNLVRYTLILCNSETRGPNEQGYSTLAEDAHAYMTNKIRSRDDAYEEFQKDIDGYVSEFNSDAEELNLLN